MSELRDEIAFALADFFNQRMPPCEHNKVIEIGVATDAVMAIVEPEIERSEAAIANRCSCDGDPIECSHEAARGHAEATLERVRELHARIETPSGLPYCTACSANAPAFTCVTPWPCDTIRALDGDAP